MRRARAAKTLPAALTLVFAVLLSAHLLAPSTGNTAEARAGGAGFVGHGQGSCHHESGSDNAGQLRRTRARVGNRLALKRWPPTDARAVFVGVDPSDESLGHSRTALRYGAGVPPRDTSPPALQVFRI